MMLLIYRIRQKLLINSKVHLVAFLLLMLIPIYNSYAKPPVVVKQKRISTQKWIPTNWRYVGYVAPSYGIANAKYRTSVYVDPYIIAKNESKGIWIAWIKFSGGTIPGDGELLALVDCENEYIAPLIIKQIVLKWSAYPDEQLTQNGKDIEKLRHDKDKDLLLLEQKLAIANIIEPIQRNTIQAVAARALCGDRF